MKVSRTVLKGASAGSFTPCSCARTGTIPPTMSDSSSAGRAMFRRRIWSPLHNGRYSKLGRAMRAPSHEALWYRDDIHIARFDEAETVVEVDAIVQGLAFDHDPYSLVERGNEGRRPVVIAVDQIRCNVDLPGRHIVDRRDALRRGALRISVLLRIGAPVHGNRRLARFRRYQYARAGHGVGVMAGVVEPGFLAAEVDRVPVALLVDAIELLAGHGLVSPVVRAGRVCFEVWVRNEGRGRVRSSAQINIVERLGRHGSATGRFGVVAIGLRRPVVREVRIDCHDIAAREAALNADWRAQQ